MSSRTRKSPAITDAEWAVLRVVWDLGTPAASEVVAALRGIDWKPKTIHTLLARLAAKKVLRIDKSERPHRFVPRVRQEDCVLAESRSFLERVFDGRLVPFLACFLEKEKLSAAEIEQLKRILEDQ